MSSTGFPTLAIDVTARRSERFIGVAVLLLALAAIFQLQRPLAILTFIAACALMSIAGGFLMLGWLGGGRRVARIVCQADGRWVLCDSSGRATERELSGACRVSSHAIWLQWQGGICRPLLLLPGDVSATDFRRLVVRLRLMPGMSQARDEQSRDEQQ
jgi:hypothetical protein